MSLGRVGFKLRLSWPNTMQASRVPFILLGHVTQGKLMVDDEPFGMIAVARKVYEEAIPRIMAEQ